MEDSEEVEAVTQKILIKIDVTRLYYALSRAPQNIPLEEIIGLFVQLDEKDRTPDSMRTLFNVLGDQSVLNLIARLKPGLTQLNAQIARTLLFRFSVSKREIEQFFSSIEAPLAQVTEDFHQKEMRVPSSPELQQERRSLWDRFRSWRSNR